MERPLLWTATAWAVGCALGGALDARVAWSLLALATACVALALGARGSFALAGLLAAALAVGAAAASAEERARDAGGLPGWLKQPGDRPVLLAGRVVEDAFVSEGRALVFLDVDSVEADGRVLRVSGRVRATVGGEAPLAEALEGDRVRLWAMLREPRGYAAPGARDTAAEARREGIVAFAYCKSARLVEVDAGPRGRLARLRSATRATLARFVGPGPEEGVVRAMLLGDRAGLDRETLERFRASGTYHVLALSGAQVALVAGLLGLALRRIGVGPLLAAPAVIAALAAYAALVGADPPVVRAAVMASFLAAGRALELDSGSANLLGAAALLLLAWRPSDVADPGFQLSFVATFGLIVLAAPIRSLLPRLPLGLDLALATSAAAQLALAPLLAAHFHRLAPAALLLNLAAVPLASAVLLLGAALASVAPLVPALGPLLGSLAFAAARMLLWTSEAASWRLLDARVPDPWPVALLVHAGGVAALACGRARCGTLLATLGVALLGWGGAARAGDGRLEVTFLDVGQGDAIVLRSPSGRHAIVDTGGSFDGRSDTVESVVAPFLWRRGVTALDLVVLTHAHPDHVGGAARLLRSFRVGEVWEGPAPRSDRRYAELDRALREAGVRRRTVLRGVVEDWDGVRLEVLGPLAPRRPPAQTRNDDSVVVRTAFGATSILLTGDIEAAGESALVPGEASVLKVAHHGSRTSSSEEFLGRCRPRIGVVSVGFRNPFGHPNADALGRLRSAGVRIFRTDLDGSVALVTDGRTARAVSTRSGRDESL